MSAENANVEGSEAPQQEECRELFMHGNYTGRLFVIQPMPKRIALLLGAGADEGLLYVAPATEAQEGLADGNYAWADPRISGGFVFDRVVIVTLIDEPDDESEQQSARLADSPRNFR